jgi:hypothetical protein
MQAPRSLSKTQTLVLESLYLFLRTLRPFLQSLGTITSDVAARELLNEQIRLLDLNRARLIAGFDEVSEAAQRWGGGR